MNTNYLTSNSTTMMWDRSRIMDSMYNSRPRIEIDLDSVYKAMQHLVDRFPHEKDNIDQMTNFLFAYLQGDYHLLDPQGSLPKKPKNPFNQVYLNIEHGGWVGPVHIDYVETENGEFIYLVTLEYQNSELEFSTLDSLKKFMEVEKVSTAFWDGPEALFPADLNVTWKDRE